MPFSTLIVSSILAFVAAAPAPVPADPYAGINWSTVDYSGVDFSTIDYSGIDWKTVDYSGVDWNTVNYNGNAPAPSATAAPVATSPTTNTATATASAASSGPYGFVAIRSGDIDLQYQAIYPNGTLKLGGTAPESYSPTTADVPVTTEAAYIVANNQASLAVAVPGGQQLYVASDGTIGYTQPHSAQIPDAAVSTGFSIDGTDLQYNGASDFVACPVDGSAGVYEIVIGSQNFGANKDSCKGISIRAQSNPSYQRAFEWN